MDGTDNDRKALLIFLKVALPAIEALETPERADAFDGIAVAADGVDEELARAARATAKAIRDAQALQLSFANVLADAVK